MNLCLRGFPQALPHSSCKRKRRFVLNQSIYPSYLIYQKLGRIGLSLSKNYSSSPVLWPYPSSKWSHKSRHFPSRESPETTRVNTGSWIWWRRERQKVFLLGSLLIGWVVWIYENFIDKTVLARCPGSSKIDFLAEHWTVFKFFNLIVPRLQRLERDK